MEQAQMDEKVKKLETEPAEVNKVEYHGNTNIPNENIDEKEHTEEGKSKLDKFI